jgi:hypothetical protein
MLTIPTNQNRIFKMIIDTILTTVFFTALAACLYLHLEPIVTKIVLKRAEILTIRKNAADTSRITYSSRKQLMGEEK